MAKVKTHYSTGEVANFCGVTLRTVINWIKAGKIAAFQLPGTRGDNRITLEALTGFMEANHIPLPPELRSGTTQAEGVSRLHKNHKPTALIVDDDPAIASAILRVIRPVGYRILKAQDGFEAGMLFGQHKPTFMTLDLQMPKLDGFSVLEQLKEDKDTFICVISGMGQDYLDRATAMRADAALTKPFDQEALIGIARRCFERASQ